MTILRYEKDKKKRFKIESIYGDCLEKLGVINKCGGYAIIDRCRKPKVGDLVHCRRERGTLNSYIKQVKRIEGDNYIVGTAYLDESKDYEFEAAEIIGVVIETYGRFPKNYREYVRPTRLRKKAKEGGE